MYEVGFHEGGPHLTTPELRARDYDIQLSRDFDEHARIAGAEFLANIIFPGVLERYPGMQFVLGEGDAGWIPYVLKRVAEEYDDQFSHMGFSLKPSKY